MSLHTPLYVIEPWLRLLRSSQVSISTCPSLLAACILEWAGKLHFWACLSVANLTFFPQHFLVVKVCPRSYTIDILKHSLYWNLWSRSARSSALHLHILLRVLCSIHWTLGAQPAGQHGMSMRITLEWTLPKARTERHTFGNSSKNRRMGQATQSLIGTT